MQIEPSESAFAETYGRGQAQVVWCTLVADLDVEAAFDKARRSACDEARFNPGHRIEFYLEQVGCISVLLQLWCGALVP